VGGGVGKHKFLSRKQKIKLQQIVDRREKKSHRADLLNELQMHQLPTETFDKLTPLVKIQTEGLKRLCKRELLPDSVSSSTKAVSFYDGAEESEQSSARRKKKPLKFRSWSRRFTTMTAKEPQKNDPKVLGFDDQSSDSSMSEEEVENNAETEGQVVDVGGADISEVDQDDTVEEMVDEESPPPMGTQGESNGDYDADETVENKDISKLEDKKDESSNGNTSKLGVSKTVLVKAPAKTFVVVKRKKEIQDKRSKLPIIAEEQVIMESITDNLVTVVAGETGSGKTTQIPQFLYEAGYTLQGRMIGKIIFEE
jgi:ATP-dependent RNA helicase DHX37/DHR1